MSAEDSFIELTRMFPGIRSRFPKHGIRIGRIFELDASWKDKPPSEIKRLREQFLRPHVTSFFAWVVKRIPGTTVPR